MLGLTCRLGRELVPVGSTHCQQPVAQIQVKPLLSGYAAHHLEERAAHENRRRVNLMSSHSNVAERRCGEHCQIKTDRVRLRWRLHPPVRMIPKQACSGPKMNSMSGG